MKIIFKMWVLKDRNIIKAFAFPVSTKSVIKLVNRAGMGWKVSKYMIKKKWKMECGSSFV